MDQARKEKTKAANQAWRKKPRKFAPKSRLGCKTCKIRRVKCDLSQPSCLKCQSTGRTCDGYGEMPPASKTEVGLSPFHNEKADTAESRDSYHLCTTNRECQLKQWHPKYHGLILQNPRPFMILPSAGSTQTEAMCFFEYISIKNLNEYRPCQSWRATLMYFSQTVPAVRHAAIALALIHRSYLTRDSSDSVHQSQFSKSCPSDKAALFHYNRAIQLLLNQEAGDSTETTAITLLVCYLFTCFDQLAGNYMQALKHLRGGVKLSGNMDQAMLKDSNTYDDAKASGVCALIYQVTRQIHRLDMQAVTFLVDWTPTNIQETLMSPLLPPGSAFQSLDQAADCLQILIAQVMGLRNAEPGKMPALPLSVMNIVLGKLETWSSLFENMMQQSASYETPLEAYPLVSLLRLQHTISWTLLSSYGPGREMEYDRFLPQFQKCVVLASDVAVAHERYSGSLKPTFTPEIGIIPVLYLVGVKCRHPVVRRKVLSILRRQTIREAVWDSTSAARVVERVIELEEGELGEGGIARSMEQIGMWQRIETVSWVHVLNGQSLARVDLSYTFCAQEGTHTESLMI